MQPRKLRVLIASFISTVVVVMSYLIGMTLSTLPAQAAGSDLGTTLMKKVIANGLYTCYNKSYMKTQILESSFTGVSSILTTVGKKTSSDTVRIPTQVGNTIVDGTLSCLQVFEGYRVSSSSNSARGLKQLFGTNIAKGSTGLLYLGWTPNTHDTSGGKRGCLSFTYLPPGESTPVSSGEICFVFGADNKITEASRLSSQPMASGSHLVSLEYKDSQIQVFNSVTGIDRKIQVEKGETWEKISEDFIKAAKEAVNSSPAGVLETPGSQPLAYEEFTGDLAAQQNYIYKKPDTMSDMTLRNLTGYSSRQDLYYTPEEKAALYRTYIQNEIDAERIGMNIDSCSKKKSTVKKEAEEASDRYVYHKSNEIWCVINVSDTAASKNFNLFPTAPSGVPTMHLGTLKGVIMEQAKDRYDDALSDVPDNESYLDGSAASGGESAEAPTPACWEDAASLGWIICPVINGLSKAIGGIYEFVESSFLMIDSDIINPDNNKSIYKGWTQFRDIANVIFVILIVLVILSQVTGIGISNYGIKKILPRLIMVAILVNLSYIICQLAVDLTNLLGVGLKQLFYGLAEKVAGSADNVTTVQGFTSALAEALLGTANTVLAGVGVVAGIIATVHNWDIWMPIILLFLLSTVISILFFAIVLGVRQAGIIILIALSPAAIVCYALPNTQKLFDKWFKLFTSLLVVFPICGVLMGGGIYACTLMLSAADGIENVIAKFFFTLVAMLMQVVPFFLVPGLVKSSLALAGNIGTRISNFGSRMGTGINRGIRSSEGFKDYQERMRAHNAQRFLNREQWREDHRFWGAPGRLANRIGGKIRGADNRFGRAAKARYDRRLARAAGIYRGYEIANAKAAAAPKEFTEAERAALISKEEQRQRDTMMENQQAVYENDLDFMSDPTSQGAKLEAALDALEANPQDANAIANMRALQNILSQTDPGQKTLQNIYNKRMFDAQQAGNTSSISQGMKVASQYLSQDYKGLKSDSRSLYNLVQDMKSGKATDVFANDFKRSGTGDSVTYYNNEYDAGGKGADKMNGQVLNAMNDAALERIRDAAQRGDISYDNLEKYAGAATDALTNNQIDVSNEHAKIFNDIRKAFYDQQKTKFTTDNAGSYFDHNGRQFKHKTGNQYEYTDNSGISHTYTRDSEGNFMELGGTDVIGADRMADATQHFNNQHGSAFQRLNNNQELNIDHQNRKPRKINLAARNWGRDVSTGLWINTVTNTNLTPDEIQMANAYEKYNQDIDDGYIE